MNIYTASGNETVLYAASELRKYLKMMFPDFHTSISTEGDGIKVGTLNGEGKYRIVIWLDGNDRECDQSISGGELNATFKFIPKAVADDSNE